MNPEQTIFVVDDDPAVARALVSAGKLLGLPVVAFASALEFLNTNSRSQPGCLVLDIKMPGMTGLELQQTLTKDGNQLPIIMISGHADVGIAVEAMSHGAVSLLEKPFRLDELVGQIRRALEKDTARRTAEARRTEIERLLAQVTPKEHEVLDLLVSGKTNKQIATDLHLSIRAVEDRRARLMKKMQVNSVAELVLLASRFGLVEA